MDKILASCWSEIDQKLTAKFVAYERPLPTVPKIMQTQPSKRSWFSDLFVPGGSPHLSFLHALSVGGHQTSLTPIFQMPDMWVMPGDHYKRLFERPASTLAFFDVTPAKILFYPSLFVTQSGSDVLVAVGREIFRVSVASRIVYRERHKVFERREHWEKFSRWSINFAYAHSDGTFWLCDHSNNMISCYTENLHLVGTRQVKYQPMELAILNGVMIVIEEVLFDDDKNLLSFYKERSTEPFHVIQLPLKYHMLRVCHHTNEIYVSCKNKISVYSTEGTWLRDIAPSVFYITSFAVSEDGHVLVYDAVNKLSVWTYEGTLVCDYNLIYTLANFVTFFPRGRAVVSYLNGLVQIY